jgi:hypothetical protein
MLEKIQEEPKKENKKLGKWFSDGYRALAKYWHPDVDTGNEEKMKYINKLYDNNEKFGMWVEVNRLNKILKQRDQAAARFQNTEKVKETFSIFEDEEGEIKEEPINLQNLETDKDIDSLLEDVEEKPINFETNKETFSIFEDEEEPINLQNLETDKDIDSLLEDVEEDKSIKIKKAVKDFVAISKRKDDLFSQKEKIYNLSYELGVESENSQIDKEYDLVCSNYIKALDYLESLTGKDREEIEKECLFDIFESDTKQEQSPEVENRFKEIKGFLSEKSKDIEVQVDSLEGKKKNCYEKFKGLISDKRLQLVVGLAIAGVAIIAPPTEFINTITFGMQSGILPESLATKATAIAGLVGGAFMMSGISDFIKELNQHNIKSVALKGQI